MTDPNDPTKKDPPQDPPQDPPKDPSKGGPDPVPYERFKEINDKNKTLETQLSDLQKQLKDKEDAGKTELEKLQGQVSELTQKWESEQQRALRLEVSQKHDIPIELVNKFEISAVEELAHAEDTPTIKEFLKPAETKGFPPLPKGGNASTFSLENKSPEEIRKANREGKIKGTKS